MTDIVTAPQKAKMRADIQGAQVFAIFDTPATVYSCRVNQTFTTHDMVAQFTFDGGSGTLANVKPDMTVLIGSTAGAYDIGICRARKAWGASTAYVGEGSEIAWANDLYVTVLDDFGLWPRHLLISSGTYYADYDVAYSDQHTNFDPVPILGGDAVAHLTGASVSIPFSWAASYCPGSTITAYSCAVTPSTGVTITNPATSAPTIAFTAGGRYSIAVLLTAANGKTFTGYICAYIIGGAFQPFTDFTLDRLDSENKTGFGMTCYANVAKTTVRDRCKVILFERAYYQNTEGSVGTLASRENILATGWISGETINAAPDGASVSFTVEGALYWLEQIQAFPTGLVLTTSIPTKWTQIQLLTIDKALIHVARWRSTITRCMDVFVTGDTRYTARAASGQTTVLAQLNETASQILAFSAVDRYGRLFIQKDYNLIPLASRSGTITMTLTDADIESGIEIPRVTTKPTALVDISGVAVSSSGIGTSYFSLSYGHVFGRFGSVDKRDNLLADSQAGLNSLAGLIMGKNNNQYPEITINLAGINRVFDSAPQTVATLAISSAHDPRGLGYAGNAIARRIRYSHNPETGRLQTTVTFEAETFEQLSTNGDPPPSDAGIVFSPFPPLPPLPPIPPPPIEYGAIPVRCVIVHCYGGVFATWNINDVSPTWHSINGALGEGNGTSAKLQIMMSAHRFGSKVYTVTTFGAYMADLATEFSYQPLAQVHTLAQLEVIGSSATAKQYYGITTHPINGVTYFSAGQPMFAQAQTAVFYTVNGGASWSYKKPATPGAPDPDEFWGFDYLRGITVGEDGLLVNGRSGGLSTSTLYQHLPYLSAVLYRYPGTNVSNFVPVRVGDRADMIFYSLQNGDFKCYYGNTIGSWVEGTTTLQLYNTPVGWIADAAAAARNGRYKMAFDPLGTTGMFAHADGYFWQSTDLGNNWTQKYLIPNTTPIGSNNYDGLGRAPVLVSPAENMWIAGANYMPLYWTGGTIKRGMVMVSTDNGANWVDKTGNLYDIGAADLVPSSTLNTGLQCFQVEFLY